MSREHDYFGALSPAPELWSESMEVGEQHVEVRLRTESDAQPDEHGLNAAAALIAAAAGLDLQARNSIVGGMSERGGDVVLFLQHAIDELGDEIDDILVDISGDREMDLIRSLLWEQFVISVDRTGSGEGFARLVYGIDSDRTEQRVAVTFAIDLSLVSIEVLDDLGA